MLFRSILISLTCIAVVSCNANAEIKVPKNIDSLQLSVNIKNKAGKIASLAVEKTNTNTTKSLSSGEKNNSALADDYIYEVSDNTTIQSLRKGNNKSQTISTGPAYQKNGNYMILTSTGQVNSR